MNHWLMKTEPTAYSWDQLLRDRKTIWDGVRNYQARNNMKAMLEGDAVLIYHSIIGKEVVGLAHVSRTHFPEPNCDNPQWVSVEITANQSLLKTVTLEEIKQNPKLQEMGLIKQSRLSVMPVTHDEFEEILRMSESK